MTRSGNHTADHTPGHTADQTGIAPADAAPRRNWSVWTRILAYLLMMAVASGSIWFIDRLAMRK